MTIHESPTLFSVDLRNCRALAGLRSDEVIAAFEGALQRAGANVVQQSSHVFPKGGLTSVLILRESHAVIHTWPETGTVNIDVFSCTSRLRTMEAVEELRAFLGADGVSVCTLPRADGHSPALIESGD
jgi:S-adenosylmethionine decarboxylase proenzyme